MTPAQRYIQTLEVGDQVTLLDTSNDRTRDALVRQLHGTPGKIIGLQVYVLRFNSLFELDRNGVTTLGRFKLVIP